MAPPTDASKLVVPTADVTLPLTKDSDGQPVVVRIRRLSRTELLVLMGGFPMLATETKEQIDARRERVKTNPFDKEAIEHIQQSVELGRRIVVTAAVEPRFHMPGENQNGGVDVALIDDDEAGIIVEEVLKLSNWNAGQEDSTLGRFPDGNKERRPRRKRGVEHSDVRHEAPRTARVRAPRPGQRGGVAH